jgi:hypothetical protein
MASKDTLKDFAALQNIAETDDDHAAAVEYVQCRSGEGRSAQLLSGISAIIAGSVAALLHERVPEASTLAVIVSSIAGLHWYYGYRNERQARSELSDVHGPRIHMILKKIRERVPTLAATVDRVEASLLPKK